MTPDPLSDASCTCGTEIQDATLTRHWMEVGASGPSPRREDTGEGSPGLTAFLFLLLALACCGLPLLLVVSGAGLLFFVASHPALSVGAALGLVATIGLGGFLWARRRAAW